MVMIPLAPWLPDYADFDLVASADMKNVIPSATGYRPMTSFVGGGVAGPELPKGVFSVRDSQGVAHTFQGGLTKLYKLDADGATFSDVSRTSGGPYATAADGRWSMFQFGNDVIASNGIDATQKYTLGVSTAFAALGGGSPIGTFGGVIRGFAVLARLSVGFNQLRWAAIENSNDWVPSALTLADGQEFPDGGQIMGFVGGEYGVVFQDNAISRMSFEGPPVVFRFDEISKQLGCRLETSIAAYENLIFFLSNDGFKMMRGAAEIVPIGDEKIDRWFEENANPGQFFLSYSSVDSLRRIYWFSFATNASMTGLPDVMIGYHWPTGEWTKIEQSFAAVYNSVGRKALTIDSISDVIDTVNIPIDSNYWISKSRPDLGAFDASGNIGSFSGSNMEATVETKDMQLTPGRKSLFRGMRPMLEGVGNIEPLITILARDHLQEEPEDYGPVTTNEYGFAPLRVNARYHRVRMTVPAAATWKMMRGIDDLRFSPMGMR
jgi:hypothetical protein